MIDGDANLLEASGKLTEDFGGTAAGNIRSALEELPAAEIGHAGAVLDHCAQFLLAFAGNTGTSQ